MPSATELFAPVVAVRRLHPAFQALRDSMHHGEARSLMDSLYQRMDDPNGNFLEDFQTDGFHSRLFELACFAYLESAGLSIDRSNQAPDFLVSRDGITVAIEAATANPPTGRATDISVLRMQSLSKEAIAEKVSKEFPRRMASILRKKLKHGYHEFDQCRGKPLVFMIAPFFEPGSVFYSDEALLSCLYANDGGLEGFFEQANAACISAVLYCNSFTVPKFFRLATNLTDNPKMTAKRSGICYLENSEGTLLVREFEYEVGKPSSPEETWAEGVTLFLNPNAEVPVPPGFLPNTCTFSAKEGRLTRDVHGFHPVISSMIVNVTEIERRG